MIFLLSLGFLGIFTLVGLANLWTAPRFPKSGREPSGPATPLVSVLIPARNEAPHIEACVTSILATRDIPIEVLVGDDESTDDTAAIVRRLEGNHPDRVRLIRMTTPLQPGWTGKARTCGALANEARGSILIFCDADVRAEPNAIAATLSLMQRYDLGALTAMPRQKGGGPLVQALVALVTQCLVMISLPLALVKKSPNPALAMGNGQWFAWRRSVYDDVGGHGAVKSSRLEDVDLARLVKRKGHRLMAALAPHHLTVSMYQTWSEARFGFRKNLYILLGGSPIVALIVAATALLALMAPILAWSGAWSQSSEWGLSWPLDWRWEWSRATRLLVASSLYCGLGMLQMRLFRTPRAVVIRMPIATLLALWILLESWWAMSRKNVTWKGRLLPD